MFASRTRLRLVFCPIFLGLRRSASRQANRREGGPDLASVFWKYPPRPDEWNE